MSTHESREALKTSDRLTRERFHELLDACLGAHLHAYWVGDRGTRVEYEAAEKAATDARIALTQAVFP